MQNKEGEPVKRPHYPLIIAACALVGLIPIMIGVATDAAWIHTVDQSIISVITAHRPDWLTTIVLFITSLGNPPVVVFFGLVLVGILFYFRRRRYAWFAAVSVVLLSFVNTSVKHLFLRQRPFVQNPNIHPLTLAGGYSFPSGHASGAMLLYGTVILLTLTLITLPWLRRLLVSYSAVMIGLIGLSRIYVQVHFPTDVLAGLLEALVGLMLVWWLMYPWLTEVGPTGWVNDQP